MSQYRPAWQRTLRAFAGRGIEWPSDSMRVDEDEAQALLAALGGRRWSPSAAADPGDYAILAVADSPDVALFQGGEIVGFYLGSSLWVARRHRGRGLSPALVLAAAELRGGSSLPPGVVFQGYTGAGAAAHRAAHRQAVGHALAAGLPVPAEVLAASG